MTKRTLKIGGIVAAVLLLAAVPIVYAQGFRHMHGADGYGPLAHLGKLQSELNLSDAQVDQIKAILKDAREQNEQYRAQMRNGFDGVVDTLIKDPNNVAAAQAIVDQQSQNEHAVKLNMLNAASKALNVLTPDQRQKLGTVIAQHRAQFQRHRDVR